MSACELPRVRRPCDECPWRVDATPGRFTEERWDALLATGVRPDGRNPQMGDPLFACHKTDEGRDRTCAGWLAQEGAAHVTVRFAVVSGRLDPAALSPGEGWPELHEDVRAAAAHDLGYELDV